MAKFLFVSILLFVSFNSANALLLEFGQGNQMQQKKQSEFILTTWNIYKGSKFGAYFDLHKISQDSDFVLLQEFLLNKEQEELMKTLPQTHWALAQSFLHAGEWTGVATMSKWQPHEAVPLSSPGTEPIVGTPKMTLITKYQVQGQQLWLINLHGLNFDITHANFKEQIDDIIKRLESHEGPLIFAGDFNTWSKSRFEHLIKKTQSLGLSRANIENPMGPFQKTLDHIFYRGLVTIDYRLMTEITTSDHHPLQIRFQL
jgi:endonuclease/exonuclease/phosphatase (EEP) superfamily protein YafD